MENSNQYQSKQLFETILQLGLFFLILGFFFYPFIAFYDANSLGYYISYNIVSCF
jgi:hypothetical protein